MDANLFKTALVKFAAGFAVVGLLLFVPAGTLAWWRGQWWVITALSAAVVVSVGNRDVFVAELQRRISR